MADKNYWGYRIDTKNIQFFKDELTEHNRLRQGWGWDKGQDLKNMTMDEGAKRNCAMLKVKKGDILLIPNLSGWGTVTIAEATEDWDSGYRFEIPKQQDDYGHIFPAKCLKFFNRHGEAVTGNIRSTLRNPSRFWNMTHFSEDIENIINTGDADVSERVSPESRAEHSIWKAFQEVFNAKVFSQKIHEKFNQQLNGSEWEDALVFGLQSLFPFYQIEKVGGRSEIHHGTDILVRLPGIIPDYTYAIAIQVKDYQGMVNDDAIDQVNKADAYFTNDNTKLIDKFVIYTKVKKADNPEVGSDQDGVHLIFEHDLEALLVRIAKKIIGINDMDDIASVMRDGMLIL